MSVESKIKELIEGIGVAYIFDNWQTANVRLDDVEFPVIINLLPVSGSLNIGKQQIKDYPNCMFAFLDKTEFDFDGTENDAIIERCKVLAKRFLSSVNNSGVFQAIEGDVPYSVVYDKLDVNVTGVCLELKLREVVGEPLCRGVYGK